MLPTDIHKNMWGRRVIALLFILALAPVHYLLALVAAIFFMFVFTAYAEAVGAITLATLFYGAATGTQIAIVVGGCVVLMLIERIKQKLIVYS